MKAVVQQGFSALFSAFVFALGLGLSGMTRADKIIGFLTLNKNWDPSLLFVMLGAVSVHIVSYRFITRRNSPFLDTEFHVPKNRKITKPLVIGSSLFGLGWGLGGYCPGPALTALAGLQSKTAVFVLSMVMGMVLAQFYERLTQRRHHKK